MHSTYSELDRAWNFDRKKMEHLRMSAEVGFSYLCTTIAFAEAREQCSMRYCMGSAWYG